jgi:DNA-binding PadR family transcriptional regulator
VFAFDWAKRTHKGLRRWILFIVSEKPRTGVEIMDIMEANLQGWWRPSPGSIYPLLDSLAKEGVLAKSQDKHYSLTPLGREEFEHPFPFMQGMSSAAPRSVEDVLGELSSYVSYLEDIAQAKDGRLSKSVAVIVELSDRLHKLGESA